MPKILLEMDEEAVRDFLEGGDAKGIMLAAEQALGEGAWLPVTGEQPPPGTVCEVRSTKIFLADRVRWDSWVLCSNPRKYVDVTHYRPQKKEAK